MTDSPSKVWSEKVPNLQLAWDSTSLRALKTCPRKYYYSIVRGLRHKVPAFPLEFGILFHTAMEHYSHYTIFEKLSHNVALRKVLQDTLPIARAKLKGAKPERQPMSFARAVVNYLDRFEHDVIETAVRPNGHPAAELSFRLALPLETPDGGEYLYCGHIDRLARYAGGLYVLDYKTTASYLGSSFFKKFTPDAQMSGYTLAGKVLMGEKVEGTMIDGVKLSGLTNEFERGFAPRHDDTIDEWAGDLLYWIKQAEGYARQNYWPLNDTACHHYSGCQFVDICSKSPQMREQYLTADFEVQMWDPLKSRGREE